VVEPLGLLASKRKDLLGAWSKIIHPLRFRCRVGCPGVVET
jgi:hypothetical protein